MKRPLLLARVAVQVLVTGAVAYSISWTIGYLSIFLEGLKPINWSLYWDYFRMFWIDSGFVRVGLAGLVSLVVFIPVFRLLLRASHSWFWTASYIQGRNNYMGRWLTLAANISQFFGGVLVIMLAPYGGEPLFVVLIGLIVIVSSKFLSKE